MNTIFIDTSYLLALELRKAPNRCVRATLLRTLLSFVLRDAPEA